MAAAPNKPSIFRVNVKIDHCNIHILIVSGLVHLQHTAQLPLNTPLLGHPLHQPRVCRSLFTQLEQHHLQIDNPLLLDLEHSQKNEAGVVHNTIGIQHLWYRGAVSISHDHGGIKLFWPAQITTNVDESGDASVFSLQFCIDILKQIAISL